MINKKAGEPFSGFSIISSNEELLVMIAHDGKFTKRIEGGLSGKWREQQLSCLPVFSRSSVWGR